MTQWEIWTWDAPAAGKHPVVVVSHPDTIAARQHVNVLFCSTQRRTPRAYEVVLNAEDGLDWPTLCRCDILYAPPKAQLTNPRGYVCPIRREAIIARVLQCFGWQGR